MRNENAKLRLSGLAARQFGLVSSSQINQIGVPRAVVSRWCTQGYLHPVLPRVYAVGHRAPSVEAELAAALLYAGPGALLSHATAAWWLGLVDRRPPAIDVSTSRRCRSIAGCSIGGDVLGDSAVGGGWIAGGSIAGFMAEAGAVEGAPGRGIEVHGGLPTTTVAQTLVDYAARASLNQVRVALAQAEYRRMLDIAAIESLLGHGRTGTAKLRDALRRHQPRLAYARSRLERAFIPLCEAAGIPVPEVNRRVAGWTVDFLWRRERLVVEVDGYWNHRTPAQVDRDRRMDLALRAAGFAVNRYSRPQVEDTGQSVIADVTVTLAARRAQLGLEPL